MVPTNSAGRGPAIFSLGMMAAALLLQGQQRGHARRLVSAMRTVPALLDGDQRRSACQRAGRQVRRWRQPALVPRPARRPSPRGRAAAGDPAAAISVDLAARAHRGSFGQQRGEVPLRVEGVERLEDVLGQDAHQVVAVLAIGDQRGRLADGGHRDGAAWRGPAAKRGRRQRRPGRARPPKAAAR